MNRKVEPNVVLVVVTCDKTIHFFNIPRPAVAKQEPIVPGSRPEDALLFLLKRQVAQDLEEKRLQEEKAKPSEEGASPIRSKFMRSKTIERQEDKSFRFSALRPDSTIALEDFTIRTTNRGDFAVKITSKGRAPTLLCKLNFSSSADQQAFITASLPLGGLADL